MWVLTFPEIITLINFKALSRNFSYCEYSRFTNWKAAVSQCFSTSHYFGIHNSLFWGGEGAPMHCRIFNSILDVLQLHASRTSSRFNNQKRLQVLSNVPWGAKSLPVENSCCANRGWQICFCKRPDRENFRLCGPHMVSVTPFSSLKMWTILRLWSVQKTNSWVQFAVPLLTFPCSLLLCYFSHEEYSETRKCWPSCWIYRFSLECLFVCPEGASWC